MCPQNNDTTNIVPAVEITDDEDATRDDVNIVSVDWGMWIDSVVRLKNIRLKHLSPKHPLSKYNLLKHPFSYTPSHITYYHAKHRLGIRVFYIYLNIAI